MGVGVRSPFLLLGHEKCQAHHPGQAGLCGCSETDTWKEKIVKDSFFHAQKQKKVDILEDKRCVKSLECQQDLLWNAEALQSRMQNGGVALVTLSERLAYSRGNVFTFDTKAYTVPRLYFNFL